MSKAKEGILLSGSIPFELGNAPSVELFHLRDGAFLMVPVGLIGEKMQASDSKEALSDDEKNVIRKLISVRFDRRTEKEIQKTLASEEKETLLSLMDRGTVSLFHKGKYEHEGVYSISEAAFNQAQKGQTVDPKQAEGAKSSAQAQYPLPSNLEKNGWMVLEEESEARAFTGKFEEQIKKGEIVGLRAFDGRYYVITAPFAEEWEPKVSLLLSGGEKNPEEMAVQFGIAPEGCRAILLNLCEKGEAIEKHKGKFAKA